MPALPARVLALAPTAALAVAALVATSGAEADTATTFTRVDVDTAVGGASFSVVGEVFPGEQNIVAVG